MYTCTLSHLLNRNSLAHGAPSCLDSIQLCFFVRTRLSIVFLFLHRNFPFRHEALGGKKISTSFLAIPSSREGCAYFSATSYKVEAGNLFFDVLSCRTYARLAFDDVTFIDIARWKLSSFVLRRLRDS